MNSVEADDAAVVQQTPQHQAVVPPPPPQRRPRMREVSSRFMSPMVPSNPIPNPTTNSKTEECRRSKCLQRRRPQEEEESHTDEGSEDTTRSVEGSRMIVAFGSHNNSSKAGGVASTNSLSVKKYQEQGKRFKENNGSGPKPALQPQPLDVTSQTKGSKSHFCGGGKISRPDTPRILVADRDRVVPSRYKVPSQTCHRSSPSNLSCGVSATSAAAKLLQVATSGSSIQTACRKSTESIDVRTAILQKNSSTWGSKCTSSSYSDTCVGTTSASTQQGSSCPNSPVCVSSNKNRTLSDVRSSMPEVDMLPMSTTCLADKKSVNFHNVESCNDFRASTCARSLNFAASSSTEHTHGTSFSWHSVRATDLTATYSPSRALVKNHIGSVCLPPHPSCIKLGGVDARKGRKYFTHQEETQSLKLLHNYCLQWRFANAKAEASMRAQKVESERQFNGLGRKLFELRDAVKRKRLELGLLRRMKTLSETVESQMLYLDQWSGMEEEYSGSLSGVINSLLNLSLRLPISSEVKVNAFELADTLNVAVKVMDTIGLHIKKFMLKAEETENLVSDLARIVGGERSLIEELGESLSKIYASQVEECSLRGHLFQLHRGNTCQLHE